MHLAEDLVQTSLTRLYLSWTSVRRRGNEEAYVRRILVNAYVDETRRARWHREEPHEVLPDRADLRADLLREVDDGPADGPDGLAVRARAGDPHARRAHRGGAAALARPVGPADRRPPRLLRRAR